MPETSLFDLLVLSLANAALVGLGIVPEPETQRLNKNLENASYNIELMGMLHEKTRGNLSAEESRLLEDLLYDLRLKYVEAKKQA